MTAGRFARQLQQPLDGCLVVAVAVVSLALLPMAWIVISGVRDHSLLILLGALQGPFLGAVKRSFYLMAAIIAAALVAGWPAGTLLGLVRFPGQSLLLASLAVPVFTPTFLWAIGLSSFRPFLAYRHQWFLDGFPGALLTGLVQALPLALFAALLVARTVPASQIEATRLAAGFGGLLKACARFSLPASFAAAVLGSVLGLMDPGSAQIMGYHGVASEVLIAFAARYDAGLATQKALLTSLLLLPFVLVISWKVSTWSEAHLLGRDLRRVSPAFAGVLPAFLLLVFALFWFALLSLAVFGFLRPLRGAQAATALLHAWTTLRQSAGSTLRCGLTAALVAGTLGATLTVCCGGNRRRRVALVLFSYLFLSLPSSLHALGFAAMAAHLPRTFDWLARGNAVGFALGLRLLPIPAIFCLQAWSLIPQSCHEAAAIHGVPLWKYLWKIVLPRLWPPIFASLILVALVGVADVSSTLLLLPPGAATFTTRIFGVIDNTSERVLSALCVVYLTCGFALLVLFSLVASLWPRRTTSSLSCRL